VSAYKIPASGSRAPRVKVSEKVALHPPSSKKDAYEAIGELIGRNREEGGKHKTTTRAKCKSIKAGEKVDQKRLTQIS